MSFTIITKNNEKTFDNNELVNISSKEGFDYFLNTGFDFMLTVQFDAQAGKCILLNQFHCQNFLFKGQPLPQKLEIEKVCKIMVKDSDEFITIKLNDVSGNVKIAAQQMTEQDLKE